MDSGQLSTDTDSVLLQGSDLDDTIHLSVEASTTDYDLELSGEVGTLLYDGVAVPINLAGLTDSKSQRDHIEFQLEALVAVNDATVSGEGPWKISLVDVQDSQKELTASTGATVTSIKTAFVQRLEEGVADSLLAGAPDIDSMFDNPGNKNQLFYRRSGTPVNGETFTLEYNTLSQIFTYDDASAASYTDQLLTALQGIDSAATLKGSGVEQDPWYISFSTNSSLLDKQGNYYSLVLSGSGASAFTNPVDIADAAAQTRAAGDLPSSGSGNFQRVYYNFTAEQVSLRGRDGNDVHC